MATTKPRITITLEPEQYQVLQRLSGLQKAPMARIVSELMEEITPVLARVADALEVAVKAHDDVKANLRRACDEAEEELRPIAEAVKSQFDMFTAELQRLNDAGTGKGADDGAGAPATDRAAAPSPQPVITGATGSQRRARGSKGEAQKAVRGASPEGK